MPLRDRRPGLPADLPALPRLRGLRLHVSAAACAPSQAEASARQARPREGAVIRARRGNGVLPTQLLLSREATRKIRELDASSVELEPTKVTAPCDSCRARWARGQPAHPLHPACGAALAAGARA